MSKSKKMLQTNKSDDQLNQQVLVLCNDFVGLVPNTSQHNIYCDKNIVENNTKLKKFCVEKILKKETSLYDEKELENLVSIKKTKCGDKYTVELHKDGIDNIYRLDVKIRNDSIICKVVSSQPFNCVKKLLANKGFVLSKGNFTYGNRVLDKNDKIINCGFNQGQVISINFNETQKEDKNIKKL
jgi:hypothetical protein